MGNPFQIAKGRNCRGAVESETYFQQRPAVEVEMVARKLDPR